MKFKLQHNRWSSGFLLIMRYFPWFLVLKMSSKYMWSANDHKYSKTLIPYNKNVHNSKHTQNLSIN